MGGKEGRREEREEGEETDSSLEYVLTTTLQPQSRHVKHAIHMHVLYTLCLVTIVMKSFSSCNNGRSPSLSPCSWLCP